MKYTKTKAAVVAGLVMAITVAGSTSIIKGKSVLLASTAKAMTPEASVEAETEALSSHFVLPTDPESRVRMPIHTKVITDWAPRHTRHRFHRVQQ